MNVAVPVVLFVFNRPETTARVFEAIRAAAPRTLFVFADGPRGDHPEDAVLCAETRAVTERVDWPCDVTRDYADMNRGTPARIADGLASVFAAHERAIVLEDDCLPDPTFFPFCETLLAHYATDERVMTIGGSRPSRIPAALGSYSVSRYPLIWGWATWRRAWQHFDLAMAAWPTAAMDGTLDRILGSPRAARYWAFVLDRNYRDARHRSWDYSWLFASWLRDGFSIVPASNLVSNIGFGAGAVHCTDAASPEAARPLAPMPFPLIHPADVVCDTTIDDAIEAHLFSGNLDRTLEVLHARLLGTRPQ